MWMSPGPCSNGGKDPWAGACSPFHSPLCSWPSAILSGRHSKAEVSRHSGHPPGPALLLSTLAPARLQPVTYSDQQGHPLSHCSDAKATNLRLLTTSWKHTTHPTPATLCSALFSPKHQQTGPCLASFLLPGSVFLHHTNTQKQCTGLLFSDEPPWQT